MYCFSVVPEAPAPEEPQGQAPEFVIKPKNTKVTRSQVAIFSSQVIGEPTPEVTWLYNGQEIKPEGRYKVTFKYDLHHLEISDVTPKDVGEYQVVARNPFGEVTCSATLDVEPKKTNEPQFIEVYESVVSRRT